MADASARKVLVLDRTVGRTPADVIRVGWTQPSGDVDWWGEIVPAGLEALLAQLRREHGEALTVEDRRAAASTPAQGELLR